MARYEFKLPDIGEGIAEAEIVAWHVKVGDQVEEDQAIADLMTDKATVEMETPVAGRVLQLAGEVGDQVAIGSVLIVFDTEGGEGADVPPRQDEIPLGDGLVEERPALAKAEPSFSEATDDQELEDRRSGERRAQQGDRRKHPRTDPDRRQGDRRGSEQEQSTDDEAAVEVPASQPAGSRAALVSASPAVRKRARDLGVELAQVRSAGGDRIRHSDLDAYLLYNGGAVSSHRPKPREDEQIKVVGLRRKIAENMQEAKRRIPHFSYVEEVDVTALEVTRAMMNGDRGDSPRLTLLPFLVTAICLAISKYPQVNARYDDEANVLTRFGAVHMGVAAQTDSGLMVPVIRNAQNRDIWELAAEVQRLADATRGATATREELSGSTITISSLGPMGGIVSTPVINRPEVGIIAVNKVLERPTVVDGRIEIRKMMNLSSSFDHRVVDGWDAASFIQEVKRLLEHPLLLLSLR